MSRIHYNFLHESRFASSHHLDVDFTESVETILQRIKAKRAPGRKNASEDFYMQAWLRNQGVEYLNQDALPSDFLCRPGTCLVIARFPNGRRARLEHGPIIHVEKMLAL